MHTKALGLEQRASSSLSRYGTAFMSVMLATVFTLVLRRWGFPQNFALFYAAVLVSAWLGGFWPALIATALSTFASLIILHPSLGLYNLSTYDSGRLLAFILLSFVVSSLGAAHLRSEKAHRASEQHYRLLFDRSLAGVFLSTLKGQILDCNESFATILGFDSPREVLTRPASDFYFDTAHRESYIELLKKEGSVTTFELCIKGKDDRPVWIIENVSLVADNVGAITMLQGTIIDITGRKKAEVALRESEERYRELFENARDAIYVHDLNGTYVSVNRAAEVLSGYPRNEIIGRSFEEFISPEQVKEIRARLGEKLTGRNQSAYEVDVIAKDGHRVQVEVNSRLMYENGIAVGVQGMARDISDRKMAEEVMRNLPRRLIDAQEAERRRVARELHDEIGQALTAVRINLQNLQQSNGDRPLASHLDGSLNIIDSALEQVRDLALNLRPSVLDDLGLAASLRWYLDREASRAGLMLDLNIGLPRARLPIEIETASFRITQEALTNIVRHARARQVFVELVFVDTDLRLVIRDDGVGFDVGAVRHRYATNVSLGLQGMRERVLAVGGRIEIQSTKERGTEVCVQIPLHSALLSPEES